MMREYEHVVPFSFDLSTLVQRSVASLYSHLVTRPTGRALRLSVVRPVNNEEKLVEHSIRRVRAVPLDIELICIDDGSRDSSAQVLAQHGWGDDQRRPRLRELPVLEGVRHLKPLPSRSEIYDEIWERRGEEE